MVHHPDAARKRGATPAAGSSNEDASETQPMRLFTSSDENARLQRDRQNLLAAQTSNKRPNGDNDNNNGRNKRSKNNTVAHQERQVEAFQDDPAHEEQHDTSTDIAGPGVQATSENTDVFNFNMNGEVESDVGLVIQGLDRDAQSRGSTSPLNLGMISPQRIREYQHFLERREKKKNYQKKQINDLIKENIFKDYKFTQRSAKEKSIIAVFAERGLLKWDRRRNVSVKEIALLFHKHVSLKIKSMRSGTNSLARRHFLDDRDTRPRNLFDKLSVHYRQYFDEDGNLKPGMEAHWDAFFYFVMRILATVNARNNKFNKENMMALLISDVFTVSDEAYALLMVDNYYHRWLLEEMYPKDSKEWKRADFDAKFTSSAQGRKEQGWDKNGIARFNYYFNQVEQRRTGTPEKADMVDVMFRKRYAESQGFTFEDDGEGPIGAASLAANTGEQVPEPILEPCVDSETREEMEKYSQVFEEA